MSSVEQEMLEAEAFLKIRRAAAAAGVAVDGVSAFAARRHFIDFIQYTMPSYIPERFHRFLAAKLQAVVDGKIRRLLISAPPQRGKPLSVDSLVLMADGSRRRLGDVRVGDHVIGRSGRPRRVTEVFEQGRLPVLRITTESGRSVEAAHDHPFLTPGGWLEARALRPGMVLANLSRPGTDGLRGYAPEAMRLAGYFVGDGNTTQSGLTLNATVTCYDPQQREDIMRCAEAMGFGALRGTKMRVLLSGGVRDWLRDAGLAGKGSHDKRVPEWVFGATQELIGQFVGAYFACDGTVSGKGLNRKGTLRTDVCLEFYSVNRPLLQDVQHLLLRLGVQSRLRRKKGRYSGAEHESWRLSLKNQDDVARFIERVPVVGAKARRLASWGVHRTRFDGLYLPDSIESVEEAGTAECRCLAVEEDESFTADDFVVHNSQQTSKHLPAYWLARRPNDPIILTSYGAELAEEHSEDARNIVLSQEYGELFPHIRLRGDTAAKKRWRLEGYRGGVVAAGVQGPIIGRGGMLGIIDDPFESWAAAQSPTIRAGVWNWYRGTFRGRMWEGAAIIVIATRWHKEDLIGKLLAEQPGQWEFVRVPALAETQAERDRLNESMGLQKGLPDPIGRKPGEPISPRRYSQKEEEQVREDVGSEAHAAEYQGAPRAAEGNKFKEDWFEQNMIEPEAVPRDISLVRYWDKAGTDEAQAGPRTAFTVGLLMGKDTLGIYYVIDVVRAQLSDLKRNLLIKKTAERDAAIYGNVVEIWIEKEPASGGKESAAISVRQLSAFPVHIDSVNDKGSKLVRARPYAAQMENGNVKIVRDTRSEMWVPTVGEDGQWMPHRWNKPFREEHTEYPNGLKDQVDAGSGGYAALTVYEVEQQEPGDALDEALGRVGGTW